MTHAEPCDRAEQVSVDIRDGVAWKPWWVRYAEFEGEVVALSDHTLFSAVHRQRIEDLFWQRYEVSGGLRTDREKGCYCGCGQSCPIVSAIWCTYLGKSLEEALAAFADAELRLIRGEL